MDKRLVVGLGNPGAQYRNTRHNIGFIVLDKLAQRLGCPLEREKFQGLFGQAAYEGKSVLLLKPMTFMNRSGVSIAQAARNQISSPEDILVAVDDVSLPLGRLRLRKQGSAGGHNGLKSAIEHLGANTFPRLRIGVGAAQPGRDLVDHVLGKFLPEERPAIEAAVDLATDAICAYLKEGIDAAMNRYNIPPNG